MSKRKRVSADEKRTRILQFFHEKKEFYTLKELENTIPKECGVIQQAVKDVLQALVDDGLVHSDKIGTSVYFWSFPGERIPLLEAQNAETGKKILILDEKFERLKSELMREEVNKEDYEQTRAVIKEIKDLKAEEEEIKKQIMKFNDADPEVIAEMNKKVKFYKDGANTWTDNIFNVKTWCNQKFNIEGSELDKQFRIPDDLDYLE
ncbi:meiotic nuclear division protein 1 homolog [Copidosoma floridanum]|uniref:meiotic nuclear division protein 1 homolog n=1 Tax=Copidosoma floridanum TaxID=29053 RepID=UPI0006C9798D|nr:meiotic nuclear division protein 1 homolog [Copidosoma floridanum]